MLAVGAADEGGFDGAVAKRGLVDGEALLFPVVGFRDAVAHCFFHQVRRVLPADGGAHVAALVEHGFGVCAVGHGRVWKRSLLTKVLTVWTRCEVSEERDVNRALSSAVEFICISLAFQMAETGVHYVKAHVVQDTSKAVEERK